MKVAIVAPTSIPSRKANTLQVMKMTQAIAALGHTVNLIIPDSDTSLDQAERGWDSLADHYGLQDRFPMEWLPARPGLRKYDYAWNAVRRAGIWGAELIYTRLPQAAALAASWNRAVILEVHDLPQGTFGPILLRGFLSGRGARKLVVISRSLVDDIRIAYRFPQNSELIDMQPDGVDLARFEDLPIPEESRERLVPKLQSQFLEFGSTFSAERFTVGYTGHLYQGRGIPLILEIAAQMPGVHFLLIGGEPGDVQRWQQQVKDRHLDNITLTGFIPNAELPNYQAACDVLVMPYQSQVSASSGGDIGKYLSPMKLFEYLACGRAICSSNLPVLQEVLSPEIAVLLPPDDVEAWVAAIQELQTNPTLRKDLGVRARATASAYSWEARAENIIGAG